MVDSSSYRLYPQRWLVLASFSLLSMTSSWAWITWSPISSSVSELWNVTEGQVDNLSGVYMYMYVPGSFLSLWLVVNRLHLRKGLLLGAILNASGILIRYVGMYDYQQVYFGTLLCAMAQTFTLSAPPFISGSWFGAEERSTATALGVLANQFGTAVGLGATGVIDLYSEDGMVFKTTTLKTYLGVQLGVALLTIVLVFLFAADRPPTSPSLAASMLTPDAATQILPVSCDECAPLQSQTRDHKMSLAYLESVRVVFRESPSYIIVFGLSVGVYYAIPPFLSQLVPTWSPRRSGWLGVVYQLSGVLGSFCCGPVLDRYKHHRTLCLLLLVGALLSLLSFISFDSRAIGSIFGIGFCLAAFNTGGLELGTAATYPASELAVAGILESAAELGGFLLVTIGSESNSIGTSFLILLCGTISIALVILSFSQAESKRPQ